MKLSAALLALVLPVSALAEPRLDGAGASIPRNAVGGAGGLSSGGGTTLNSSVGEGVVLPAASAANNGFPGLMALVAQPGSITAITAVTKDTDTLVLNWAAPGVDGFLGAVSGFWRIDYSNNPGHVFSPSTYVTEIATTVSAGDQQFFKIGGLSPDTTYYARVYLADARRVFAETSAQDNESTLAKTPPAPTFTGVFFTSVTISWTLPAGGAQGYLVKASTTDFGTITPGGLIVSSQTPSGLAVTLTVTGLNPNNTYYFNLGSLNWQGNTNFDFNTIVSTLTRFAPVVPVTGLAVSADDAGRKVTLTWSNPAYSNPGGVTVVVSTNPITLGPTQSTAYLPGAVLADGSVVKSTAMASSYLETSLTLDTTGYFALYSRDTLQTYSVAVTTYVVLDLPPMAPAGLAGALDPTGSSVTLTWQPVKSSEDGAAFKNPASPLPFELNGYNVYRSTGLLNANWVYIGSAPANATAFIASVPVAGANYFYRVSSFDAFRPALQDNSMAVDTSGSLYAVASDGITRMLIPPALAAFFQPSGNPTGKPLVMRSTDRAQDLGNQVMRSISFDLQTAPDGQAAALPAGAPPFDLLYHYVTNGGQVVPSAKGLAPDALGASGAAFSSLSVFYVNAGNAANLFGTVDPLTQTVHVQAPYVGTYQIRSVARTDDFSFDLSGLSNKAITPNGDGLNDTVVFTFNNPRASAVSGKIYDVRGRFVSDMRAGPVVGNSLIWDGQANGVVVSRGVYLYEIRAEGKTFSGTVVVIR